MTDLIWVGDRGILVASELSAVGSWELDENETLAVSEFCRCELDDSVLGSGTRAAR